METSTSPLLREVYKRLRGQEGFHALLGSDGLPMLPAPAFGGYEFRDEDGTLIRIVTEDPEAGLEVYVLDEFGVLMSSARFSDGTSPSAIALYIQAAF